MKRMLTFIAALLLFLSYAFFRQNQRPQASASVGVLTLMHHPALDQIYAGLKAGLKEAGYGRVKINYQNANGDQSNLHTMAAKLVNEDPQALVGITTPAAQALASQTTKVPLVLGAVTDPKAAGLVKSNQHPAGNVTGVSDGAPVKQQLGLIKRFLPHLKTLGVIYTSSDNSAVSGFHEIQKICRQEGINLKAYSIANSNDLNQVAEQMFSQVDAAIVPTDNTIAAAMQTLVKAANAAGKPVFPAADTMVKAGGLATYSVNQYDLGKKTGKMLAKILAGKSKPQTTPILRVKKGQPVLNLRQAKKLGIKVPASFLQEARQKGVIYR